MPGLVGEQDSELKCSQPPQGWNPVNRNLFLSTLIVGSYTKAPREWAPVCLVTASEYFLKKTNWQLSTSSQEGSELMNPA